MKSSHWPIETVVSAGFGAALFLVGLMGLLTYRVTGRSTQTSAAVVHSHEVLDSLAGLLSLLKDVETGQRGYLITGDRQFLDPYFAAFPQIDGALADLRRMAADNPAQQNRLDALEPLVRQRLVYAAELVALRDAQGLAAASQAPQIELGRQAMDQARLLAAAMEAEERSLLAQREAFARAEARNASVTVAASWAALAALVLAANVVIQRGLAERRANSQALRAARTSLEARVAERTAQLAAANALLQSEVAERRRAEDDLRRANRALRMHGECSQALFRAQSEAELLREVCRIAVEVGGYRLAWVGLTETGPERRVRPAAHAGSEDGYLDTLRIAWADEARGPVGAAVRSGEPQFLRDSPGGPGYAPWDAEAVRRGYLALAALPLKAGGQTLGVLNIYAGSPDAFDSGEQAMLAKLAQDLAFGVETLRGRAERRRAEAGLQEHAARAQTLVAASRALAAAGPDYHAALQSTARLLSETIGDGCSVRLLTDDGQHLGLAAVHDRNPQAAAALREIVAVTPQRADQGLSGRVLQTGAPVLVAQVDPAALRGTALAEFEDYLVRFRVASMVFVPLRAEGRVTGVVGLTRAAPGPPYTAADQEFLQEVADRAALAISNGRLLGRLQQLNRDLEARVAERTASLAAANQELESFAYSVSHDLRTPLRTIDGFSQALLEDYGDQLDAEGRAHLGRVRGAAQRMAELIDDLLNLSRVTRAEMRQGPVDLSEMARAVARDLQAAHPERAVRVHIAEGVTAQGDARLLRVALENLLANAWKFTGGRAEARIEFGLAVQNGDLAYFVRDDGAGFDMAYAHKLFGPFQRLHSIREFPGTGIGLATVQRIISRHGGQVWAESAVGQGATFYFTLGGRRGQEER